MTWALDARRSGAMSPEARLTLVALADYANAEHDHNAWPSAGTLAGRLGITERSVRRNLSALEELGVIERGDGRHVAHYRADRRPAVWRLVMGPPRGDARDMSPVTPRGDAGVRSGVTPASPKPKTEPLEETTTPQPPAQPGEPCPIHPNNDGAACRGCGTSPRQRRDTLRRERAELERRERPPLCASCGVRHPGACLTLTGPPADFRARVTKAER